MTALNTRIVERYLKEAYVTIGQVVENGTFRMRRYREYLVLWDLTNAGKRGKSCERLTVSPSYDPVNGFTDPNERLEFLNRLGLRLEDYSSFGHAVGSLKDLLVDYPDSLEMETAFERGVDVMPAGFKELRINTPFVSIRVEFKDFSVTNLEDKFNEPTCIPAIKGGIKAIPLFYRWVQDNEESLKHMKYRDILDQMKKLGVPYHTYCAID
jgi:hypothetical protein